MGVGGGEGWEKWKALLAAFKGLLVAVGILLSSWVLSLVQTETDLGDGKGILRKPAKHFWNKKQSESNHYLQ